MALEEAIVFQDLFTYNSSRDLYNLLGGNNWSSDFDLIQTEEKLNSLDIVENQAENFPYSSPLSQVVPHLEQWGCNSCIEPEIISPGGGQKFPQSETSTTMPCRPKRRRSRSKKNMEDIENQRMTHIAVERNRRKQMNEYLSLLRSLMPESYVQRVDQASIVGGAINYVKELEHQLQLLSGQNFEGGTSSSSSPFAEFFSFPQYSTSSSSEENFIATTVDPWVKENKTAAMADIEVTMVESHANLKIRSKTRPKQLIKMVNGLQSLRLTILHLSVTTVDQVALYSLCVKVEDDCNLNSGEEIATSINQMLARIQVEGSFSHT